MEFFDKLKAPGRAECRRCHNEFVYEKNKQILGDHLKSKHYFQEENVHYVSYENCMERLYKSMSQRKLDFPPLNKRHLKIRQAIKRQAIKVNGKRKYAKNIQQIQLEATRVTLTGP